MAKILLVEDDNNLREIYEARLQAEGYTIVSAKDGEEALVVAKAEKPDLVISDVMMPKISGFEMLDILRNTPGLKETKVIMLTALGQAEDQSRADRLGADRYLVKSQVTLEDIVKVSYELLNGSPTPEPSTPQPVTSAQQPAAAPMPDPTPTPVAPTPEPSTPQPVTSAQQPAAEISISDDGQLAQTEAEETTEMNNKINDFLNNMPPGQAEENRVANDQTLTQAVNNLITNTPGEQTDQTQIKPTTNEQPPTSSPAAGGDDISNPVNGKKVIEPLDLPPQKSLNELVAEEEANNILAPNNNTPTQQTPANNKFDPSDPNNIAI